jgi:hypothetical protein
MNPPTKPMKYCRWNDAVDLCKPYLVLPGKSIIFCRERGPFEKKLPFCRGGLELAIVGKQYSDY